MDGHAKPMAGYRATHFRYEAPDDGRVATITLDRPERKNPLTFDSYAELRDIFRALADAERRAGGRVRGRAAATSAPAATCTRSSGRSSRWRRAKRAARVHAHDRRPGEGHARLPAADRRGRRRRLRRRRRDDRDGVRPAPRHAARRRWRSCSRASASPARHGRVRDPAAHHRPGTRGGAALHRPLDDGRGGGALGLLQSPASRPRCSPTPQALARALADGPALRARHDQDACSPGMVDERRRRRSRPRRRRRPSACRRRTSGAPTGVRGEGDAGVRGRLTSLHGRPYSYPDWPFFEDASPRARARRSTRWARVDARRRRPPTTSTPPAARWVARARRRDGWLRHGVPAATAAPHAPARRAHAVRSRARCSRATTGSPTSRSPCRGSASGADLAVRLRRAARTLAAARSPPARPSRPSRSPKPDAGSDVAAMTTTARRDGDGWRPRRREDLDLATAASPTSTSSSRARARRPARAGISAFVVPADARGLSRRRAHRRDRAASARAARASTAAACRATRCVGEPGEGFKIAMAHARRVPRHGRRGGARLRAARARRGGRPRARRASCFGAPLAELPADAGRARRHGDRRSTRAALLVYRAAWTRDTGRRAHHARGRDGEARRDRDRAAVIDAAVQLLGGEGVRTGHAGRAPLPRRSARCASTKARPRCNG